MSIALAFLLTLIQPTATPAAPVTFAPSFLVGRWSSTRECRDLVEYRSDGTYETSTNAKGRWSLQGDMLTMRARSRVSLVVRAIGRNEFEYSLAGGRTDVLPSRSYRCRSPGRPAR